jgi:hypothetical protein
VTDAPVGKVIGHTTVRFLGRTEVDLRHAGAVFTWSAEEAATLLKEQGATGDLRIRVTLLAGLLVPGVPIRVPWYGAFRVLA